MPAKDLTSDANSSFASDRKVCANILAVDIQQQPQQKLQKKWVGGCRDSSDVSYRRRVSATGSSLNPDGGEIAFQSKTEKNTRKDALNRCRNGGNCVPPKVRASTQYTNVPTIV